MIRKIRIGTRESELAMAQSRWVAGEIQKKHPDFELEFVPMKTKGDVILDKRLDKIGGKGLFVKELENALMEKTIDIAVHSMKDMPGELPQGLTIAAVSKREDPRDVFVSLAGAKLGDIKAGAVVGTSSVRREALILDKRPDLSIKTLRGNVLTRLNKLLNEEYDGLVLAAAGLKRLGFEEKITQYLECNDFIPAVGQGVLCIEAREKDDLEYLLDSVHNEESKLAVDAERAFLIKLSGSCSTPLGAYAHIEGSNLKIQGMLAVGEKNRVYRACVEGKAQEAAMLGEQLTNIILDKINSDKC